MDEVCCMVCAFPLGSNESAVSGASKESHSKGKSGGAHSYKTINNSDTGHTINRLRCYGACTHCNDICSICFLRIRSLQRNFNCPVCKTALPQVLSNSIVVDPASKKQLQLLSDFEIWGDNAGPEYTFEEKSQIFFPQDYYRQHVESLFQFKCKVCDAVKRDLKSLKTHYQADHNLYLCNHCLDHKQIFPAEQKVYTQQQYDHHLKQGDGDGSEGHPNCEFCRRRYYDKTALFTHLSKDHYSCHLCEKDGIKFKYFSNYDSLEAHFRRSHHLCHDELCLSKKFVVFSTSIELSAHQRQYHNSYANQNRNIPIHFKIKRNVSNNSVGQAPTDPDDELTEEEMRLIYNNSNNNNSNNNNNSSSNETKYDAGLAGRASNGEWQIELPAVREPVEMRGAMRTALSSSVGSSGSVMVEQEEYPGLPGSYGRMQPIWTGAAGGEKQKQQQKKKSLEDFPLLESKPKSAAPTKSAPTKSAQAPVPASSLLGSSWSMPTKKDKRLARPKPQQQPVANSSDSLVSNNYNSASGDALDSANSSGGEPIGVQAQRQAPAKKAAKTNNNLNNIANINNIFKSLGLTNNSSNSSSGKKSGGLTVVKTNAVIQKVASGGNLAVTTSSSSFTQSEAVPSGPISADIFSSLAFPAAKKSSSSSSSAPAHFAMEDLPPPPPGFVGDYPLYTPSQQPPAVTARVSGSGPSIADSWVTVGGAPKSAVTVRGKAGSGVSLTEAAYPSLPPSTIVPGLLAHAAVTVAASDSGAKRAEGAAKAKPSKKVKSDLQSLAFKKK